MNILMACVAWLGFAQEDAAPKDFRFSITLSKHVGPSRGGEWDWTRILFDGEALHIQEKSG